jgi:hypothetical protein
MARKRFFQLNDDFTLDFQHNPEKVWFCASNGTKCEPRPMARKRFF